MALPPPHKRMFFLVTVMVLFSVWCVLADELDKIVSQEKRSIYLQSEDRILVFVLSMRTSSRRCELVGFDSCHEGRTLLQIVDGHWA